MPIPAAPRAVAARPAAKAPAPAAAARPWTGLDAPVQAKLDVGPAHDRFEAEADRVADSIAASPAGPAAPVAISPLPTPGAASRRALQREEKRPIEAREKKEDAKTQDLSGLLQTKRETKASKEEPERVQAKSDPKPGPLNRDEEPIEAKVQTKREAKSPKPDEMVQKQPLAGSIQRDNVDDDTVLETSIQAKREGAVQRETVVAEAEMEQEQESAPQPVQREASSAAGFTAPAAVESGIAAMRGGGAPLAPDVRGFMEPRFGHDLSAVRIHDGAQAASLAGDVHARAFTIGQDVFFGAGQYQPSTGTGRALLAHELTHTIQQGGGSARAQPARIQRATTPPPPNPAPAAAAASGVSPVPAATPGGTPAAAAAAAAATTTFSNSVGEFRIDAGRNILRFNTLPVPKFNGAWKGTQTGGSPAPGRPSIAASNAVPWAYRGKSRRGSTTARRQWLDHVGTAAAGIVGALTTKMKAVPSNVSRGGEPIGYLKSTATSGPGRNFLMIGTKTELAATDEIRLPIWNRNAGATLFDVDHIQELQLGGLDGFPNFWLLEQGSNRSSGSNIAGTMKTDFDSLVGAARTANYFTTNSVVEPKWEDVRAGAITAAQPWELDYVGLREIPTTGTADYWTEGEIMAGTHLDQLVPLTQAEIMARGLIYSANPNEVKATIYALATASGGFYRTVNYSDPNNVTTNDNLQTGPSKGPAGAGNQFYRGLAVVPGGITMAREATASGAAPGRVLLGSRDDLPENTVIAYINGQPFPASGGAVTAPAVRIPVIWRREFGFGGFAGKSWINELMGRLSIHGASPIEVQEAGITPQGQIYATGVIVASKALFPGLRIPIFLRGNDIFINFPIPTDKLNFGPVHVTEAAIEIGFGEHGIFLGGRAGLKVDGVGSGTVTARTTRADTILEGTFNFDMNFLNPASATVRYSMANDTLDLTLNAGVREGVLPGVTSGQVTGRFSRDVIELGGTLNLAPPLAGSTVSVGYTQATGLTIAASNIPLPISNIPGITDAMLSVRANYNPEDGQWKVSGQGSARFAIPPATGQLTIAMDGPIVTITGTAAFQQGPASGSLEVRATNAKLDEAGQPVAGQVAPSFAITGRGSASLRFGILTGTAGIELTPDQRVIISGEIALPPSHEVFARRSYERELLHIEPPEFPIWGVSLGGVGIGIMGFVDARLTFDAFVGPGTLQNTAVHVTFELAKPEEAVVDGTASFVVPAGAGFALDIGGGVRARAAVAYVQGRIGLDARLGLLAEARADVNLHWTQAEGLSLAASAHAEARPQFEVGVNASVTAGVDLLVTDIEHTWGPWRQQLGSFGPEMAVGVTVPIAWSEQAGLDFNTDNIEITRPDIDFAALMTDGFMQLV